MSEFYRDRTEGALARRQDLLRKRRDELVMMPHAVRRVVVARAARAAASTAAIVCGVVMFAVALSPTLAAGVAHYLPGINPAVISTSVAAAWVIGVIAFTVSRGRSEHRFAVAMSTYVLPGEDLDEDIERLSHERPDKVAREMAQRLEIASAALPVAAAALIVPATAIYVLEMVIVKRWPSTAMYEGDLASAGTHLLYVGIAGIFAAVAMTQPALRRTSVTAPAATIALVAMILVCRGLCSFAFTQVWLFTAVGVIAGTIAFVTWRLGRERIAIEARDPTAGAELFTIAGAWRSLRTLAARVPITRRTMAGAAALGALLLVAGDPAIVRVERAEPVQIVKAGDVELGVVAPAPVSSSSRYAVDPLPDGRLRITATFVDGTPIELRDGIAGLREVPAGWRANINITVGDGVIHDVEVTPAAGDPLVRPRRINGAYQLASFAIETCEGRDRPLRVLLTPTWHETATVHVDVQATLELARCAQ